jgi:mucin-19
MKTPNERSLLSLLATIKKSVSDIVSAADFARATGVVITLATTSFFANAADPIAANALPTGGHVVAGNVAISQTQNATSATMNINQTSQRAIVNWDGFNVGKNATVNFNQPNASAVILNRVTSASPSMINGAVNANGQVVLVNPNGVTFGRGADINAAGVVASTMDIANKDFMNGKSTYNGNGKGAIVNEGRIATNTDGGYIALLAPEVRNQGYLLAMKGAGTVAIGAGEQITLDFKGNALISLKVDKSTYQTLIENKHVVETSGGLVVMAAGAANQLMGSVIKNTGRIAANSMVNNGGVIELVAAKVTQAGTVTANSQAGQGGQINLVGKDITLAQDSKTTVIGAQGGGQVNIGLAASQVSGGIQVNAALPSQQSNAQAEITTKANAALALSSKQMAKTVTVEQGATVDASASQSGNGGIIAIWSEIKTIVAGSLKATGGMQSGNGGFIETSSKGVVELVKGFVVNASAALGKLGTWLLDPIDLVINTGAANVISAALENNNVTIEVNGNVCPSLGSCTQNGSGSLTIASGADILKAGTTASTLRLISSGIFNLNANISGENLNVIINSSIAYLNVGTSITVSQVTVQAQTIHVNGNINAMSNSPLSAAIQLLAQALYISGRLSTSTVLSNSNSNNNSNTNTNTNSNTVTYNGTLIRAEDLPAFLRAQNNSNTNLDQVYSSTAANDNSASNINTQTNSIYLQAANDITLYSTAEIKANGTTGGYVNITAQALNAQSGSLIQANGNNGPGGVININAVNDIHIQAARIEANGSSNGGSITMITSAGDLTLNGSTIQTNGSNGRGGSISISARDLLDIQASTIESIGHTHGGTLLIGNDAKYGTLPFALYTTIDQYSALSAHQRDLTEGNHNGGFIETSGQTLSMMASINAGRGGMWLLDPTNVTITASGSTGGSLASALANTGAINISASDIQNLINAGTSVTILATGTITQSTALTFANSIAAATLTFDNTIGTSASNISLGAITTTGTATTSLVVKSAGKISSLGALTATGTGALNVSMQSFNATNTATVIDGSNVYIAGNITTKGGFLALDGTGGSISATGVITKGGLANGMVTIGTAGAVFNTTTTATTTVTSSITGGNASVTSTSNNVTNFGLNGAWYVGGSVNINQENSGVAQWAFVTNSYATTSPIAAVGDINITVNNTSSSIASGRGVIDITSSLRSYAGAVNLSATTTGSVIAVNSSAAITAANGINITGSSGTAATVVNLGSSIITNAAGNISITGNNAAAGANTGINSTGAIAQNANGGSISLISNNKINQTGAITLAANTTGVASNITYDTTSGNSASTIAVGTLTIAASTSAINYIIKSAGSPIDLNAIGTVANPLSGFILLDNTYGRAVSSDASTSGFINTTTNNLSTLATTSSGITMDNAIYARGNITLNGVSKGSFGITYSVEMRSLAGNVVLTGSSTDYYGVYTSNSSLLTANNITITGRSSGAYTGWLVQIGALTLNAATNGGDISVTAIAPTIGGGNGIYQSGNITGASGSDITFISNNKIDINGAITVATNTSGTAANVIFDTTRGTLASTISMTTLSVASAGSTSDINYIALSAGSNINPGLIATSTLPLPGYILLDNTFGGTAGIGGTPTTGFINTTTNNLSTLATTSSGITMDNAIYARGNITLNGVSKGSFGITYSVEMRSSAGNVVLTGSSTDYYGVHTSNASLLTANNISITGRAGAAHYGWIVQAGALTINTGANAGDIVIDAFSTDAGGRNGIYQSGAMSAANGTNITFTSNNKIDHNGAIVVAANTSGGVVDITFDTTSGNKNASISTATVSVSTTGTSSFNINFIAKAAGGFINPSLIGTSTLPLPGYILLDNTFGCSGSNCTPASGFITTASTNLGDLATTSNGITIDNAIFARGNISLYGVSSGASGINYSVQIDSSAGDVTLRGGTTTSYGIYNSSESLIAGNNISLTGTSSSTVSLTGYLAQVGSFRINAGSIGGDITVTAMGGIIGGGNGIYQSGNITGASGSDITFTSNNRIDQNGAITLTPNTSGTAGNITYDSTGGTRASTISTGLLSFSTGTSTSAVNYSVLTAGAPIVIRNAVTVPGLITLDNTYGCSGSGCARFTGYLNQSLASWQTLVVTNNQGIDITGALNATAMTINGVNAGGGGAVMLRAGITATTGNINITGLGTSGFGVSNNYGGAWAVTFIRANNGAVNITGTAATSGDGVQLGSTAPITAKSITVIGATDTGTYATFLDAMTIVAGGTNLNVTGTVGVTTNTGIYQTGAITDNAAGSNISFITNGKINQTGSIALVANTASTAVSVTYNTTSGSKGSSVIAGALTIATGTNNSPINYIIKTSGASINPAAIGTLANPLPGYILLDNSYGCSGANCTPVTGFINATTDNLAALGTSAVGVTVNSTIFATGNIAIYGVTGGVNQKGIDISVNLTSTNGSVILDGATTTGYGVYSATSIIAGNHISITGTAADPAIWVVQIEALRINTGSTGGSIVVSGNVIGTPGTVGGIYQSGAITGANGSSISFISNNNISQNGAITLAANTSSAAANLTYDITYGNKTSTLLTGALTIPTGSTSAINYIIKTAGSPINPGVIGSATLNLPGYVLLDNTFGCSGTGCTPVAGFINPITNNLSTLATASTGVTINGAIHARDNIIINGVSTIGQAIGYSVAMTSYNGSIILGGSTISGYGVYGSAALITANNITITGITTAAPVWAVLIDALRINSSSIGGSIAITGNVLGIPGAAGGIYQAGAITAANGTNISFVSNNDISQNGAIALIANTSGSVANIIYDTTAGINTSTITAAAVTIAATGSTSAINYIVKSAGARINPGAIGSTTVSLPGYVLLDNTFGCTASTPACTPVTGFINTTTANLASLATAGNGVTINNAIFILGDITVNGVNNDGNMAINLSVNITSLNGSANFNGGTTTGYGFYSTTSLITANHITVLGTSTAAPVWAVQLDAVRINMSGGSITVTSNVVNTPGAAGGIYQAGAITLLSGSNLSFISNNDISQNGAIAVAANGSGAAANITYNTTSGNNTSLITTGALTVGAGTNTAAINYQVRTNGATISVPAIAVPGYIQLDNSCLGCATPVTTSTAATNGAAITITGALSAGALAGSTGVTINAVANGTGIGFTQGANAISSTAGGITITVNGQTGTGYSSSGNLTAAGQAITVSTATANVSTTSAGAGISTSGLISGGAVTLVATQSATATLVPITATGTITANSLTVTGTGGVSTTVVSLGIITINAGGGNITITGNNAAAGTNIGITQTGAITNNAVGSNISFISNNDITQGGAITLVANTGTPAANITYNTTSGNNTSLITTGALTVGAGTNNAAINYQVRTNGATISVPAIAVPGYIQLDNSCLGCATPVTTSTAATNGAAITITGALSAGALAGSTGVTINAVANGTGIGFTQGANAISSTAGGITITVNGQTGTATPVAAI